MFSGVKDIPVVLSASTQFRMRHRQGGEAAVRRHAHGEIPYP